MNILIHGVGKTGTTALFYAIRQALSGTVAELFEPNQQALDAALASPVAPAHILAKILLRETVTVPYARFHKKIMIVRDPRDTLISRFLYSAYHAAFLSEPGIVELYLRLLRSKESDPHGISLSALFSSFSAFQRQHPYREYLQVLLGLTRMQELLSSHPDFFVLRYEDFVDGRLAPLAQYLDGLTLQHRVTVDAGVSRVARRKGYGDWRHWFTSEDIAFFRPLLGPSLRAMGYPDDWELAGAPRIDPLYSSGYAARLIAERQALNQRQWPAPPATQAELLPVTPEALLHLASGAARTIPMSPVQIEIPERSPFTPLTDPRCVLSWSGPPLQGDVIWQFLFDAANPDPVTKLYLDSGAGFHPDASFLLPAQRGRNLLQTRFHQPVYAIRLEPLHSIHGFLVRDLKVQLL